MGPLVCVDIIDRPHGGALRALAGLRRVAKSGRPPGCQGFVPCATTHFNPTIVPRPTPRRVGLVSAWADHDAVDRAIADGPVAELARGAREHWQVRCELVRVSEAPDPWSGWLPEPSGAPPLEDDEPLLVLISGELRVGAIPAFARYSARAYTHATAHRGYLGGLGLVSSPLNTTSCSAWRSSADSRDFAFRPGGHADALRDDREHRNHPTERFLRLRPLATQGTLCGRNPFEGHIRPRAA